MRYLHHLIFDPLGLFDQIVRDSLIAALIICTIILTAVVWTLVEIAADRLAGKKMRKLEEARHFKNLAEQNDLPRFK